jgi:acyl-homoserine lactone acylase PvdQ
VLAAGCALALAALLIAVLAASSTRAGTEPSATLAPSTQDFAGDAFNVLPPGEAGALFPTLHSGDQIPLYDGLTPKFDAVTSDDLRTFFKPNIFGLGGQQPERVENPPGHPGLTIERDSFGVPHVFGDTRADVMFGAGWVAAEDRGFLMETVRGPGRIAALDVPGVDPLSLATSFRQFVPSQQTEQFMSSQVGVLQRAGSRGQQILDDIQSYVDGINALNGAATTPWTQNDVLAVGSLIGAILGRGGGDEARRSELLSALDQRLGQRDGQRLWDDLREVQDPETPVTLDRRFRYGGEAKQQRGNAVIDDGSLDTSAAQASAVTQGFQRFASNALLVSANRSANGHPLFVAGPQTGYFYPQVLLETDLHGGGVDARGASFPGSGPYVQLGRGRDFAWSATSAGSDIIDQYVEQLCGNDTTYRFDGKCVAMTTFDAGFLGSGGGHPGRELTFRQTVHGPVIGYATVNGKRVAISERRSTRGREAASALGFADLNTNEVHSAKDFFHAVSRIELTFNWFYADDRDVAMFSSGRLPIRPKHLETGLPTLGTGQYEWRGFLAPRDHPQEINPKSGVLVNWNNKPAPGFGPADDNWTFGSIQRVQLLEHAIERSSQHTLVSVVAAMNRAATQDLRTELVLPAIAAVLDSGPAPTQRAAQMLDLLKAWRAGGASRLDRDLNGRIDDPGAAIMDVAWPKIADAVAGPALGPQLDQLKTLIAPDQNARSVGSAYQEGWYGYVDKDLRTLLDQKVRGRLRSRFCGGGDLAACRASLWAALDAAGAQLESAQGPDPATWSANALPERIRFEPGLFLRLTMRWTNRPTFQQVIFFTGHG